MPDVAPAAGGEEATKTSLHTERMGLLARASAPSHHDDRRMEEWIASHLDLGELASSRPRSPWAQIIENLPGMKKKPNNKAREQSSATTLDSWKSFQVAYKRGITVVRLVEKSIVKESQIRELARDLLDLIAAGNDRIVLNFQAIERVASWMAFVVDEAWRRCASGDGGALKVCGLSPRLARMFPIAGVGLRVSLHENELAAIESPWPQASGPRPLPIEILTALTRAADVLPIRGAHRRRSIRAIRAPCSKIWGSTRILLAGPSHDCEVWLQVQVGAAKGPHDCRPRAAIRDRPRSKLPLAARLSHGQQASHRNRAARRSGLPSRPRKYQRHRAERPNFSRRRDRDQGRRSHPDRPCRLHAGHRAR